MHVFSFSQVGPRVGGRIVARKVVLDMVHGISGFPTKEVLKLIRKTYMKMTSYFLLDVIHL